MRGRVLIAGASGVVGASAVEAFANDGWDVIAVSRRRPEVPDGIKFTHLTVNLFDADHSRELIGAIDGLTHIVFAALSEKPGLIDGWSDPSQMDLNLQMLRNCVEPSIASGSLKHVALMQGTKAYGQHLHVMPIPARESSPRDPHANFYWLQEDYLKEQAIAHSFGFTVFRPPMIFGGAVGAAMNIMPVLGVYAAVCHAKGLPFGFPGGASYVWEAMDSRVLARALVWAANTPRAWGEHFNITNGDVFEWRNAWPAIAETLGLAPAGDTPRAMHVFLPEHADVWAKMVQQQNLRNIAFPDLLGESHYVADFCFAAGATEALTPAFMSTIKLREAGFCDVIDTQESIKYWLNNLIERRIIARFS